MHPLCRAFVLVNLLLPIAALAQYEKPPQVKPEQLNTSGTIKGLRGGLMHISAEGGDQWLIKVQAKPQDVTFTAAAESSFLKPGMLVRFVGKFNKRGQCLEPISNLTIVTLREGVSIGVAADSAGGGAGEGVKALFGEAKAEEKPTEKPADSADFRVVGQLTKLSRTGEMTLNAGTTIKATLAENAKLSVDINDLSYIREGDSVELKGQYYPAQKGQAWATWLAVSAKEPLADTKKKPIVSPKSAPGEKTEQPAGEKGAAKPEEKPAAEPPAAEKPAAKSVEQ